jgi:hypothetical protein
LILKCIWIIKYIYLDLAPEVEGSDQSSPGWLQCARALMSDKDATCLGVDLKESSFSR